MHRVLLLEMGCAVYRLLLQTVLNLLNFLLQCGFNMVRGFIQDGPCETSLNSAEVARCGECSRPLEPEVVP